ncbi:hypothetical protein CC86DRAFT_401781 [Ophiobolus disseminans]|uniref:Dickkopf N-terminal cysteine-rich domain-containing protein n=1 Tax=Ophiobolus disseminans TaxID=1469910 RepID=A0A6A7AET6_9PLEO|nr:hypothetical protein CC86DRAFT_401781 [Ophiobolus disseminans]
MFSIRNILAVLAILSAVPLSLAAPSAQEDSVAPFDPSSSVDSVVPFDDSFDDDLTVEDIDALDARDILTFRQEEAVEAVDDEAEVEEVDEDDVLDTLQARATCHTTSKPRRDCAHSTCPDRECKLGKSGKRCAWTHPKRTRPSGCDACKCVKRG